MASNRMQRGEETLRRGIAGPRLFATELTLARVFIDLLSPESDRTTVLAGLRSAAGAIRRELQGRVHLRRIPDLRFEFAESVQRGIRIETILHGLHQPAAPEPAPGDESSEADEGEGDER